MFQLHEDYLFNMATIRRITTTDFVPGFRRIVPAIYELSRLKGIVPPGAVPAEADDAHMSLAFKMLIKLVPKYCKRNQKCEASRLFAEGWVSIEFNALYKWLFRILPTLICFMHIDVTLNKLLL